MSKTCSNYSELIPESAKFCTKCGAKQIEKVYSHQNETIVLCDCGAELLPEAKFCTKCGKKYRGNLEKIPIIDSSNEDENNIFVFEPEIKPEDKTLEDQTDKDDENNVFQYDI